MHFDVLIVGGSAAGFYTAKTLADLGFAGSVGVISEDPYAPYDRTKLSKELLFEGASSDSITLEGGAIAGCEWLGGVAAKGLDVASSRVWTDVYGPVDFDRLVIATGATPRHLAGQSVSSSPVASLHSLSDALDLRSRLAGLRRATVVGSGFIAAETASGLARMGVDVRLKVRRGLFSKFGAGIAAMAEDLFAEYDVVISRDVAAGAALDQPYGSATAPESRGASPWGTRGGLVVCAIGSEPAVTWLGEFAANRGSAIRTDPVGLVEGETRVFAVGDVASRWNVRYRRYVRSGHWASAMVDAQITAQFLATGETRHNVRSGLQGFSSTHFGVTLQGIGDISIADEIRCDGDYRAEGWAGSRSYCDGKLCAVISYGRPAYVMHALPELLGITA